MNNDLKTNERTPDFCRLIESINERIHDIDEYMYSLYNKIDLLKPIIESNDHKTSGICAGEDPIKCVVADFTTIDYRISLIVSQLRKINEHLNTII